MFKQLLLPLALLSATAAAFTPAPPPRPSPLCRLRSTAKDELAPGADAEELKSTAKDELAPDAAFLASARERVRARVDLARRSESQRLLQHGTALSEAGETKRAEHWLREAMTLDPSSAAARFEFANWWEARVLNIPSSAPPPTF